MNNFIMTPRSEAYINRAAETSDDEAASSSDRSTRGTERTNPGDRRLPKNALEEDLVIRPSWVDAYTALEAYNQVQ